MECMTIDRNQLSDYLDKIARFLIGTGKIKTDDMMQEEIFDYVVEVVTSLSSDLADAKARAKTAEENWHKNEARIAKLETTLQEMKTDLAQCFMELYDFSFPFADDIATKYFDTWQEIREAANRQ